MPLTINLPDGSATVTKTGPLVKFSFTHPGADDLSIVLTVAQVKILTTWLVSEGFGN